MRSVSDLKPSEFAHAMQQHFPEASSLDMPEFVQNWKISKQFTLEVATAIPADFYNFKPNPDEMTLGEQMVHIAGANQLRFHQITGVKPPFDFGPSKLPPSDKASVIKDAREIVRVRDQRAARDYA